MRYFLIEICGFRARLSVAEVLAPAIVLIVLLVAGCAGMSVTERCSSYGFTKGTVEFANCAQQETIARDQRKAAKMAGWAAGQGARDAAIFGRYYK